MPPQMHQALRDYLEAAQAMQLSVQLPAGLDRLLAGDMKDFCRPAWE